MENQLQNYSEQEKLNSMLIGVGSVLATCIAAGYKIEKRIKKLECG